MVDVPNVSITRNENVELGRRHREERARLIRAHRDGSPCWWCGRPMYVDAERNHDGFVLEADHTVTRANGGKVADRLLHSVCNRSRGDGSRDHLRPALAAQRGGWTANTMPW